MEEDLYYDHVMGAQPRSSRRLSGDAVKVQEQQDGQHLGIQVPVPPERADQPGCVVDEFLPQY